MAKNNEAVRADRLGQCALCLQTRQLHDSHIIPAFAFRWLRSRSITGHIRGAEAPNLRVQDGHKPKLLCVECEQLFSTDERLFSSQFFKPVLRGQERISYGEWLLRFSTSVSWRVLKHCKGGNPDTIYTDEQERLVAAAGASWADFLQGRVPHPGQFEQHLLIFTEVSGPAPSDIPTNLNRYLSGGIEMDIAGSDKSLMTFAKIGRFVFLGMIQRPVGNWVNTKVHVRHGTVRPGAFQAPPSIGDFLLQRARNVRATMYEQMSPAQRKKAQDEMTAAILADPDRFIASDHGKSILADARMFGERAILVRE